MNTSAVRMHARRRTPNTGEYKVPDPLTASARGARAPSLSLSLSLALTLSRGAGQRVRNAQPRLVNSPAVWLEASAP